MTPVCDFLMVSVLFPFVVFTPYPVGVNITLFLQCTKSTDKETLNEKSFVKIQHSARVNELPQIINLVELALVEKQRNKKQAKKEKD